MEGYKKCPFCGSDQVFSIGGDNYWIECSDCLCYGPTAETEAEAWAAWDRREGEEISKYQRVEGE